MCRFQLHRHEDRGIGNKSKISGILILEMQTDCLLQVGKSLIQGYTLGYDCNFNAFDDIVRFVPANYRFNGLLELHSLNYTIQKIPETFCAGQLRRLRMG